PDPPDEVPVRRPLRVSAAFWWVCPRLANTEWARWTPHGWARRAPRSLESMSSNGYSIYGSNDEPCKQGQHVTYDDPEWMAMLADARALASTYRDDPCAEVERNLTDMAREDDLARRRNRIRETLDNVCAEAKARQAVTSGS